MIELFTEDIIAVKTYEEVFQESDLSSERNDSLYAPTIIGGSFEGASYKSSISNSRVEIFPVSDPTLGLVIYDASENEVFKSIIDGTDRGDLYFGDYASDNGIFWDNSTGIMTVKGVIVIAGGVGWSEITDDDGNIPADNATVGSDWSVNLSNIPTTLTTPSADGLYLTSTFLGYYSSGAWTSYIANSGDFYFKGDGDSSIDWNITTASTLTIRKGAIDSTSSINGISCENVANAANATVNAVPTNLSVDVTGISTANSGGQTAYATLSWDANSEGTFDRYILRFKQGTFTYYNYLETNENTVTIEGLVPNIAYNFNIASINKYGVHSAYSTVVNETMPTDSTLPATVANVSATPGIQYSIIEWDINTEADLAEYNIYRHTANDSGASTLIGTTRTDYFVDGGRTGGTLLYYWVKAKDTSGNLSTAFSTVASCTPTNVENTDIVQIAGSKVLIDGAVYLSNWQTSGDLTKIDGGEISTGTITTTQLNFTPVQGTNVIASINASAEGIAIDADNIEISGSTTFSSGYDPTDKVADVGGNYDSAASGARVRIFPDANTGIQVIDDGAADVFKVMVGGTDVGDVTIGDYAGGKGVQYDKSGATFTFKGTLSAPGGTLGVLTIASAGNIKLGQTGYNAGSAGFWLGDDSGTTKFSIGDPSNHYKQLLWDGSDLIINGSAMASEGWFGNGKDGDVTISSNSSIIQNKYYKNLTINVGVTLKAAGYRIFVKEKLTVNGTISADGGSTTSWTKGTACNSGYSGSVPIGLDGEDGATSDGVSGTDGDDVSKSAVETDGSRGGSGGKGDTLGPYGGSGGARGLVTNSNNYNDLENAISLYLLHDWQSGTLNQYLSAAGAGSGGAGNTAGEGVPGNGSGGHGGGSGATGGLLIIFAKEIVINSGGTISANGGNGGDGRDGSAYYDGTHCAAAGGGGGGGGGCGGLIALVYSKLTETGTISANKGSKGLGGDSDVVTEIDCSAYNPNDGNDGDDGNNGRIIKLKI